MLPTITVRHCLFLGLILASLVVLADRVARHELQKAAGEIIFATADAQLADASDE